MMSTVFELVAQEGVFSYGTVHAEVHYFFNGLGLHPAYFEHFTPLQVSKHVHSLIATKRIARATDHVAMLRFALDAGRSGFFLAAVEFPQPTEAQMRTEEKVAEYLAQSEPGQENVRLTFVLSDGPVFPGGKERLGIYNAERDFFERVRPSEFETSIEVLGSTRFLKTTSRVEKEQYQVLMEDIVASRRSVVRIVSGSIYPGPVQEGFVVLFGTPEVSRSFFFPEICGTLRFADSVPRRFYVETFANGVVTYSMFFTNATEEGVRRLGRIILHSALLKNFPGKSELIFKSVMQARISHEVGLYLLAAVKFVYACFPKERYARQYTDLQKVLDQDPSSRRKLEDMYRLCMKELLATPRIYELLERNLDLCRRLFEDFRLIALGKRKPWYNEEIGAEVDAACPEPQDRQILRMVLTFNESLRLTNFFQTELSGAMAFRLDPAVVLRDRPTLLYPEMPFGIYRGSADMVVGRDFFGFHIRFRDVARGGIRLIFSPDYSSYERNYATLFDTCYQLALTQQLKNKDIPEGGAKGVILPDSSWGAERRGNALAGASSQSRASARSCFTRYLGSLLDCMMPEQSGIFGGHLPGGPELLFWGRAHRVADGPGGGAGRAAEAPALEGAGHGQEPCASAASRTGSSAACARPACARTCRRCWPSWALTRRASPRCRSAGRAASWGPTRSSGPRTGRSPWWTSPACCTTPRG
ncbi:unnamed protein product [Prorocentrum cordatum]|nr:unnamed protein product [Polarella glacialis]